MRWRYVYWGVALIGVTAAYGCTTRSEHPLHRLAAMDYNIVEATPTGGGAGDRSRWPSYGLQDYPFRYDFGYQITSSPGSYSPHNYRYAHRAYAPRIYGYPDKGGGIQPYRHQPAYTPSVNTPRRYTHYPGVPGYRSHGTKSVSGIPSYGYGRSARGPIGGGPRSGFGYRR